jgi:hypothetical protein
MRKGMAKVNKKASVPSHFDRIENMAGNGMPDVLSIRSGRVRYLELKVARNGIPARRDTPLLGKGHGMRREQCNWMLEWTNHGGRALVVIGIEGCKMHIALSGLYADEINSMSYTELVECADVVGESPKFWQLLHDYL